MKKKRRKGYGFKQGKFLPKYKEKYKGTYPIIYRSSYELKAFRYCDLNPSILTWGSESTIIPYKDPTRQNTIHRYFMDITFTAKAKDGTIKKFLCEIKPHAQTQEPKRGRKQEKTYINECITYTRNMAKWNAAKAYAKKKGQYFIILTEKELQIK